MLCNGNCQRSLVSGIPQDTTWSRLQGRRFGGGTRRLTVVMHIDYQKAPSVTLRFADIKKLITQTLDQLLTRAWRCGGLESPVASVWDGNLAFVSD